jgi:hypothetical protein
MSPILTGVIASGVSGNLVAPNDYESIATRLVTTSGGDSSITFTSIPSGYTHLQLRYWAYSTRTSSANPIDDYNIRVGNGSIDTGANYSYHFAFGDGAGLSGAAVPSASAINVAQCVGDLVSGSVPNGAGILDILNYKNTNHKKTLRLFAGCDISGVTNGYSGRVGQTSGFWNNTNTIDTITMYPSTGNWGQNSIFALYGVK